MANGYTYNLPVINGQGGGTAQIANGQLNMSGGLNSGIFGNNSGLNNWFQNNQSTMQGIGQGLGAFTSLAQLYGMFKNLGFQKKAFKFAQEGTKRNFNAQAQGFNNEVENRHDAERTYAQSQGNDFESLASYSGRRSVKEWI